MNLTVPVGPAPRAGLTVPGRLGVAPLPTVKGPLL